MPKTEQLTLNSYGYFFEHHIFRDSPFEPSSLTPQSASNILEQFAFSPDKMMPESVVKHCQNKLFTLVCFNVLLLLALTNVAAAGEAVKYLPGFDGELPFNLETGYIGVGESNASQMFYLFVESQRSPALDPLMLWHTGGPGCSVLSAFFYEHGPVAFNYANYNGSLPSLHLNSMTWTQNLNIIYLDQPVGTGFSYSLTEENYYVNDTKSAAQNYEFLRKWLLEHPQYLTNQLFIGGDSYSGIPVPIIVQNIFDGNKAGLDPHMNIKGYILGNPKTDNFIDENSNLPFAYQLTLISEKLFQEAKLYCGGDYVNIDPNNTACVTAIGEYEELVEQINVLNILEPDCQAATPKTNTARRELEVDPDTVHWAKLKSAYWCRQYNYVLSWVWANNPRVRDALHVREHTKEEWKRCNFSHAYTKTVTSTVPYHRNLSKQNLFAMVYSGDHDFSITHIGTQNWIRTLNLTTDEEWRPWFVDGQVAGYTVKYINGDYTLIFATVKGAGHTAPEYKPKECYSMIDRFFAYFPL